MATDNLPKGRTIAIATKDEATFATAPSGNWTLTPAYAPISLGEKQGFENDDILGAGLVNTSTARNRRRRCERRRQHHGAARSRAPWLLVQARIRAPTTTGTDPNFVHVFASGSEVLPTFGVEVKKAAALFYQTLAAP